jgi:hypothetical protein
MMPLKHLEGRSLIRKKRRSLRCSFGRAKMPYEPSPKLLGNVSCIKPDKILGSEIIPDGKSLDISGPNWSFMTPDVNTEKLYVCRMCGRVGLRIPPSPNAFGGCMTGPRGNHFFEEMVVVVGS